MRSFKHYINKVGTASLAIVALLLASCNDIVNYNDGYTPADQLQNVGAPTISAVYDVADTALTTPITEGSLGQMIHLVGTNLNKVKSITFNTVSADMKEVYTYSTSVNVRIPSTLSLQHVNKIEYTTDQGTATFDFTIPFPKLTVSRVLDEFVNAGDSMTVYGSNFDLYDFGKTSKVYIGSTELGVGSVTASSMKVLIPAGTPDNSEVTLKWQDADGADCSASVPFRPTTHLLYGDFSNVQMNISGSISVVKEDDSAVTTDNAQLGRNHLHLSGTFGAWAWNTVDLSCNMIDAGNLSNLSDYVLKFEVLTPSSFPLTENSPLQFCFNWGSSYTWNPGDGAGLNTLGKWQTISLPLAGMAAKGISAAGTWQTLRIVFQPKAEYTADFCLGNFRIEKK
jgi:hypothetical protein